MLKTVLITSNQVRHRYYANAVKSFSNLAAVFYQSVSFNPAKADKERSIEQAPDIAKYHFALRDKTELSFFGHDAEFVDDPAIQTRHIDEKQLNTPEMAQELRRLQPDVILTYGCRLLKKELLEICPKRTFNMHLGLSPYYRGGAGNFFPLLNKEPEYCGVTVHLVDAGVDTGQIIHQGRPYIIEEDHPHTIGCKAIQIGILLIARALKEAELGVVRFHPQWQEGDREYKATDFRYEQAAEVYRAIEQGMLRDYCANRAQRDARVRWIP